MTAIEAGREQSSSHIAQLSQALQVTLSIDDVAILGVDEDHEEGKEGGDGYLAGEADSKSISASESGDVSLKGDSDVSSTGKEAQDESHKQAMNRALKAVRQELLDQRRSSYGGTKEEKYDGAIGMKRSRRDTRDHELMSSEMRKKKITKSGSQGDRTPGGDIGDDPNQTSMLLSMSEVGNESVNASFEGGMISNDNNKDGRSQGKKKVDSAVRLLRFGDDDDDDDDDDNGDQENNRSYNMDISGDRSMLTTLEDGVEGQQGTRQAGNEENGDRHLLGEQLPDTRQVTGRSLQKEGKPREAEIILSVEIVAAREADNADARQRVQALEEEVINIEAQVDDVAAMAKKVNEFKMKMKSRRETVKANKKREWADEREDRLIRIERLKRDILAAKEELALLPEVNTRKETKRLSSSSSPSSPSSSKLDTNHSQGSSESKVDSVDPSEATPASEVSMKQSIVDKAGPSAPLTHQDLQKAENDFEASHQAMKAAEGRLQAWMALRTRALAHTTAALQVMTPHAHVAAAAGKILKRLYGRIHVSLPGQSSGGGSQDKSSTITRTCVLSAARGECYVEGQEATEMAIDLLADAGIITVDEEQDVLIESIGR